MHRTIFHLNLLCEWWLTVQYILYSPLKYLLSFSLGVFRLCSGFVWSLLIFLIPSFPIFAGPVRYIAQGLSLFWIGLCYCVSVFLCGCMIIGRTQKCQRMLSCDWLQCFQYNLHEPQSREVSVYKESLKIA